MSRALIAFSASSSVLFLIAHFSNPAVSNLASIIMVMGLLLWTIGRTRGLGEEPRYDLKAPLLLFAASLVARIPSVVMFETPLEKAPILYALFSILLVTDRLHPRAVGISTRRPMANLLTGIYSWAAISLLFYGLQVVYAKLVRGPIPFDFWISPLHLSWEILMRAAWLYVVVGLSEEALFRGYMLMKFKPGIGALRASAVSSLLFGAWHFTWHVHPLDPYGMAYHFAFATAIGLSLCALFLWTRSLIGPIVFHATWDLAVPFFRLQVHWPSHGHAVLATSLSLLAIALLSLLFIRLAPSRETQVQVEGDRGDHSGQESHLGPRHQLLG